MDETPTELCNNCKREVPVSNFEMHIIHCARNIILCQKCQEPVSRSELFAHNEEHHVQVTCEKCKKDVERCQLTFHQENNCLKRTVICEHCELEVTADEIDGHQDYCGSRTEVCPGCGEYIMHRFRTAHLNSNHVLRGSERSEEQQQQPPIRNSRNDNRSVRNDHVEDLLTGFRQLNGFHSPEQSRRSRLRSNDLVRVVNLPTGRDEDMGDWVIFGAEDGRANNPNEWHDEHEADDNDFTSRRWRQGGDVMIEDRIEDTDDFVPCEFCDQPVPFRQLVLHTTGCRPDLLSYQNKAAQQSQIPASTRRRRPDLLSDVNKSPHQSRIPASTRRRTPPELEMNSTNGHASGSSYNDPFDHSTRRRQRRTERTFNAPSPGQPWAEEVDVNAQANSGVWGNQAVIRHREPRENAEPDEVMIPCEFCLEMLPFDDIHMHQETCDLNPDRNH